MVLNLLLTIVHLQPQTNKYILLYKKNPRKYYYHDTQTIYFLYFFLHRKCYCKQSFSIVRKSDFVRSADNSKASILVLLF